MYGIFQSRNMMAVCVLDVLIKSSNVFLIWGAGG